MYVIYVVYVVYCVLYNLLGKVLNKASFKSVQSNHTPLCGLKLCHCLRVHVYQCTFSNTIVNIMQVPSGD